MTSNTVSSACPQAGSERRRKTKLAEWIVCVILALATLALVAWQVPQHKAVSPIDEFVYIDYLAKVPTQLVVHRGEETGDFARGYLTCHGVRIVGYYPADMCRYPSAQEARLPNEGLTTGDLYTPGYFVATRVLAQPLVWLGVTDLVTAGRFVGWTWLAAAAILLFLSLRRWKVPILVASGAALLLVGSLPAYWSNTYVSTDATSLFAGSLMFFSATLVLQKAGRARTLFILFAALVSLLKLQNLMAVGAAALFLLLVSVFDAFRTDPGWRDRLRSVWRDPRVRTVVLGGVAAVGLQAIWVTIRAAIAVGAMPDQGVTLPFGKAEFLRELLKFMPAIGIGALDPRMFGFAAVLAASLMIVTIVAGSFGLLAVSKRGSDGQALAIAALVLVFISGPLLAIANIKTSGFYFNLPPRYGMSLLPFFIASAALLTARSKWLAFVVPTIAVVSYVAVFCIPEIV